MASETINTIDPILLQLAQNKFLDFEFIYSFIRWI